MIYQLHISKLQHDTDGNQALVMTATGVWTITYNGENRPIRWENIAAESNSQTILNQTILTMSYDHMGRRRGKNAQRFFYDGYLQVADNGGNTYVWDPTENVATRPLAWNSTTSQRPTSQLLFYTHDGNKNVSEVIAADGTLSAHYDYAPFGALTVSYGVSSAANPWRFSSEFADDDTATVYYNYRHYEPVTGRWVNRDPFEEESGVCPYAFCGNEVGITDFLGLLMNWYYGSYQILNDFTADQVSEMTALRKKLGLEGTSLAYTKVIVSGTNVICTCNGTSSTVSGGCWQYLSAVISIKDEIHMRPKYEGNPPRKWVFERELEHANDTKAWVKGQHSENRWSQFEIELSQWM